MGARNRQGGRCTRVEPYDLFFFEEPLHYTDPWGYAELCRATTDADRRRRMPDRGVRMARLRRAGRFDIGQPDASFTGGLGEFMNVAAMMAERGRKIATHAWGAGGSLMQNIHCRFRRARTPASSKSRPTTPACTRDMIDGGLVMKDGYVLPPDRPGLGIVLTDEIKRRYPFQPGSGEFNSVPGKVLTT